MTSAPQDRIFRQEAVQKYAQGREKNVLPRLVAPPVFLFLWCLLALLISIGIVAWLGRIPVYETAIGIVLGTSGSANGQSGETTVIIFVPYSLSAHLHPGEPVEMQPGLPGPQLSSTIETVEHQILSPEEVRQRYQVSITAPSLVVKVSVRSHLSLYAGSPVQAQIEVGSRPLLSLLPGLDTILKDM